MARKETFIHWNFSLVLSVFDAKEIFCFEIFFLVLIFFHFFDVLVVVRHVFPFFVFFSCVKFG
jgi:hypothetical protein